jgi:nitroreductase
VSHRLPEASILSAAYRPSADDLLTLLETRRSVPLTTLTDPGPTEDQLRRMLTIAARVPDHGGLEPWRFIIVEGEARRQASALLAPIFAAENATMETEKREKFTDIIARVLTHAPLIVIVVSRTDPAARIPAWEQDLSAGAVCMNLLNAAHALGFAGTWLTGWAAYSPGAYRVLGIVSGEKVAGLVYVGTAKEMPTDRKRPDLGTIMTRWSPETGR